MENNCNQPYHFETVSILKDSQVAEGKLAFFIAGHISILICDYLIDGCKSCFKDSRIYSWANSIKKQNAVVLLKI